MDKIDKGVKIILNAALTVIAAVLAVRLCTGCALVKSVASKEKVVETIRAAYEKGGKESVSNSIERLVLKGDITRKQADRLHAVAQKVYDHVVEKLECEIAEECCGIDED